MVAIAERWRVLAGTRCGARGVQSRCMAPAEQPFTIERAGDGRYSIRTFADKCLTVENRSPNNGVPIVQYPCAGDFAQHFTVQPVGDGQYSIRTFAGKCLTVENGSPNDGARIVQYPCEGDFAQRSAVT